MQSFLNGRIEVLRGDITKQTTDAIVNAANSTLLGGGGVDGAIHRAGGPQILDECKHIRKTKYPNGLPTGKAVITTGGMLKPKIIHTVGPIYSKSKNPEVELCECYKNCLKVAVENKCFSIAFPAISTGVYGFPKEKAAQIVSTCLKNCFENFPSFNVITKVKLVFFSLTDRDIFLKNCSGFK